MVASRVLIVVGVAIGAAASCAHAQFTPTSWTRSNAGYAYARDFTFDGGGGGYDEDQFGENDPASGDWSTSPTASAAHGFISSSASIAQESTISATRLSTSGTMKLSHSKPPSLSAAASYGRVQFIVAFTVATATEVAIDFSYGANIGSTGAINNYQCLFGLSSSTGLEAYAGDAAFPPPDASYSYAGLIKPGTYEISLDILVDEIAEGNMRNPMSWEYTWDLNVSVVPAPTSVMIAGVAMMCAGRRRR